MKPVYKWILFLLCITIYAPAQVGINTINPQNVLHIDGGGDNNLAGTPTPTQASNDVLISTSGYIAIGHINPAYMIDIRVPSGVKTPAFRLEDGTENNSKILLSDASGNAYWGYPGEIPVIKGVHKQAITYTIPNNSPYTYQYQYTNASITLPKGRWVVIVDQKVYPTPGNYLNSYSYRVFTRFTFSDNALAGNGDLYPSNGAGISPDIEGTNGGTTTVGALISSNINFRTPSVVSGFVIINNQEISKTYYLKLIDAHSPNQQNSIIAGKIIMSSNPTDTENRIIAMPLQ